MKSPVVLIIFNRPAMTERVFAEIRQARPPKLLVVADGPRIDRPEDAVKCRAARAVVEGVDWDCQVLKNYSDVNLGCGKRPATGITWAFENVEEAIILEDDCVPHPSFFPYCDELLERFRDDDRIFQICANNLQFGRWDSEYSYCFSYHNVTWGWATWRRAWQYYDMAVRDWPAVRRGVWLQDLLGDPRAAAYWSRFFDRAYEREGDVDFWDYQWSFACWSQNGLSVLPSTTLLTNIGYGPESTHTTNANDTAANLPTAAIEFPLRHPGSMVRDIEVDRRLIEKMILPKMHESLFRRVYRGTYSALPSAVRRFLAGARRRCLSAGAGT